MPQSHRYEEYEQSIGRKQAKCETASFKTRGEAEWSVQDACRNSRVFELEDTHQRLLHEDLPLNDMRVEDYEEDDSIHKTDLNVIIFGLTS